MQNSKSYASQNPESHESQDIIRFDRSLQELRDLRSQLHNAASHCETTFLNTNQKRMVALTRVRWNAYLPKHHHRYLSTQITSVEKSNEDARDSNSRAPTKVLLAKHEFGAEQLPLFLHTCSQKSAPAKNLWSGISTGKGDYPSSVVPVRDGLSILSRISNPTFHFQQCSSRHGRSTILRKSSAHSRDIFSLIRRAKRTIMQ